MEINNFQLEELIRRGNNEEFLKIAAEIGVEKIKCNSIPEELASIHWAAGAGNIEIVKYLLSDEVNENASLTRGNNFSPLHAASMNGFTKVVEILIEKGANIKWSLDFDNVDEEIKNKIMEMKIPKDYLIIRKNIENEILKIGRGNIPLIKEIINSISREDLRIELNEKYKL